jgi:hypothetical protein
LSFNEPKNFRYLVTVTPSAPRESHHFSIELF